MKMKDYFFAALLLSLLLTVPCGPGGSHFAMAQSKCNVHQATLEEPNQMTPEISTEELKKLLTPGANPVVVIDTRPAMQYALAHIPGTINFGANEEEHITKTYPDKATRMVLYCNGPY